MYRETVLQASQLCKVFSSGNLATTALAGLDMTISRGKLTALIGPDGAGKTTLLRLIAGLLVPSAGTLTVVGLDVVQNPQVVQERIAYMPQKFGLYEDLTVLENMNLYGDLHNVRTGREKRFARLLEMTGLAPFTQRLAGKLSGGMKQKLGLACTLVRSPEFLLLDEPTAGVDPLSRRELWQILQQLVREESLSVLVSTAYIDEAAQCAQVYVIHRGQILQQGSPEKLRQLADGCCYETDPADMPPRLVQSLLLRDTAILDAVPSCGLVRFITRKKPHLISLFHTEKLIYHATEPRLEDAFILFLKEATSKNTSGQPDEASPPSANHTLLPASKQTKKEMPAIIEVKNLVKKFGDFTAVANTSFCVQRGEVFGLLGPNGAGKTTTFHMLCGLLPASSGELRVAGEDLRRAPTQARAHIGYVAQKFSLYANLTAYENLYFFGGVYGLRSKQLTDRIAAVAAEFGLTPWLSHEAGRLPGGWKQRLSMATALLHEPKILFLDEPTSGIDPLARRLFWQQITRLSARGTTIIITTHFMEEAEYCDRFLIQDKGKILALGSPAELRAQYDLKNAEMNDVFLAIVAKGRKETAT